MEKETRSAIESATQKARRLLEADFQEQLDGVFDVRIDGRVAHEPGAHLDAGQRRVRRKIVAAIEHKRAGGMKPAEAVVDYLRDAAFTVLNRFVALKMLEARELVQPCVSQGEASSGFNEFCGLAPGVRTADGAGYRLYLECLFDELSTEVKVLFDRRDAPSALWPRRAAFLELLDILNAPALASVWAEDETIGWVYQYFNGQDERSAMRAASQAPRNSRELAVRNQFFTPRYVVQFLTDNTLGRIWYEMRDGDTALADQCEYMVRQPEETWAPRVKKDPRDLRVLDPACGSGHFLLYAFDLLVTIYQEAWADPASPDSEISGAALRADYPELDALKLAMPGLILAHNLHGVDIDPRCAQIAQLALWMRAQRAFREFGLARAARPLIRRSNIVIAEPMPGEKDLRDEFLRELREDRLEGLMRRALDITADRHVHTNKAMADSLAALVEAVWDEMALAGEMGVLLKIEQTLARGIAKARNQWEGDMPLFPISKFGFAEENAQFESAAPNSSVPVGGLDFWGRAELLVLHALEEYANTARGGAANRRRLFADDAAHGFALVDLVSKRFDAVVMNPPFGEPTVRSRVKIVEILPDGANDIYAAFVLRNLEFLVNEGSLGAITSRAFLIGRDQISFRNSIINSNTHHLSILVDLGLGVLDNAMVETSAYIIRNGPDFIDVVDLRGSIDKGVSLRMGAERVTVSSPLKKFRDLPGSQILYDLNDTEVGLIGRKQAIEPYVGRVTKGLSTGDDFRFVRLRWEIETSDLDRWQTFSKGGEYSWYTGDTHLLIQRYNDGAELAAVAASTHGNEALSRVSAAYYGSSALTWSRRSQRGFSARRLRSGCVFSDKSPVIIPTQKSEDWIFTLLGALASDEYLKILNSQAKFGSFETGPFKSLNAPEKVMPGVILAVREVCAAIDLMDAHDERASNYGKFSADGSDVFSINFPRLVDNLAHSLGNEALTLSEAARSGLLGWWTQRLDRLAGRPAIVSKMVGRAFGRWGDAEAFGDRDLLSKASRRDSSRDDKFRREILVDDEGGGEDIVSAIHQYCTEPLENIRDILQREFFSSHISDYSKSARKAPIYWQLATPSASYSVWLYIHAFGKDTLFRVQNDYVAPKLAHERRELEGLLAEAGQSPTTAQSRAIEAQTTFVEELSALLDEVKRIAPLWDPDLDDGVILNFAPLWRLVPQNRAWQKELRAAWASLVDGDYDWAHLSMRLWPERVAPKCAKDRSLAIAHDLEDVFWFEDASGKRQPRPTPTRPLDDLIAERTSPAVKAALQSLLEAPDPVAASGRGRRKKS